MTLQLLAGLWTVLNKSDTHNVWQCQIYHREIQKCFVLFGSQCFTSVIIIQIWASSRLKNSNKKRLCVSVCVCVSQQTQGKSSSAFLCSGMPTSEETPPPPASHATTYTVETSVWKKKQTHKHKEQNSLWSQRLPVEAFRWCNNKPSGSHTESHAIRRNGGILTHRLFLKAFRTRGYHREANVVAWVFAELQQTNVELWNFYLQTAGLFLFQFGVMQK